MPTYEVEVNGQTFEIDAPDDNSVQLAVRQLQGQPAQASNPAAQQLDDYYSSGIYSGEYNPLGPIARSIDAGATGIRDAVTFGFGDEIFGGGDRQEALRESNPIASVAGNIAGGIAGARGLSQAGILPTVAPGASLATRVGVGAGEGFGLGALYGLGSGEDGARAESALINGGIGGVAGGAVPLVAQGVSSTYRNIADSLARNDVARQAGVSPEVARQLAQTLDADGTLGAQGLANMGRAGNEAMLADAGPNARQVLDASIARGGPGATLASNRINERLGRGAADLDTALNSAMGRPGESLSRDLVVYGDKTNPLSLMYKRAYSQPIDYADPRAIEIEGMIRNRVPKSAIDAANNLMRVEGVESQQILARLADDGTVSFETLPDVRQLDYITRGLNQVAQEADGKGALGGTTPIGRAYGNLSRDIRSRLRELVPEYNTALNRAGTEIGKVKASEFGDSLLSDGVTRSDVRDFVREIPDAERNSLKQSVRQNIDDRIARVRAAFTDPNMDAREAASALKTMSSRANRDKLSAVLGEKDASALFDEMDRIFPSFGLKASVAENSKTAARNETIGMVRNQASPGAIGTIGRGEPLQASKRVIQALTGQTDEAIRGREDAIFSEIADYLTRPASQAIPAFQAMQNYQGQSLANQVRANRIAEILLGTRAAVYPTALQSGDRLR